MNDGERNLLLIYLIWVSRKETLSIEEALVVKDVFPYRKGESDCKMTKIILCRRQLFMQGEHLCFYVSVVRIPHHDHAETSQVDQHRMDFLTFDLGSLGGMQCQLFVVVALPQYRVTKRSTYDVFGLDLKICM